MTAATYPILTAYQQGTLAEPLEQAIVFVQQLDSRGGLSPELARCFAGARIALQAQAEHTALEQQLRAISRREQPYDADVEELHFFLLESPIGVNAALIALTGTRQILIDIAEYEQWLREPVC